MNILANDLKITIKQVVFENKRKQQHKHGNN